MNKQHRRRIRVVSILVTRAISAIVTYPTTDTSKAADPTGPESKETAVAVSKFSLIYLLQCQTSPNLVTVDP